MRPRFSPFAGSERWGWAVIAGSLVALSGCSDTDEGTVASNPGAVASQAQAAQLALASAHAEHNEHARTAMPMQDQPGVAPGIPAAPASSQPPMNASAPMAPVAPTKLHLLGYPASSNAAGAAAPAMGTAHLYHVGADGFFLDRASAIGLTAEQQTALSAIREQADLAYAETQLRIDAAESALWTLTSMDAPDAARMNAKIAEIARLWARQRTDYVQAVGSAVAVLNHAQHIAVMALPPPAAPGSPANIGNAPAAGAMPMGDDAMPMGGGAMPPAGGAMPTGDDAMPMGGGAMPPAGGAMPMGDDAMPMGGGAMPPGGGAMPMGDDAMPMGGGAMPPGGGAMPMGAKRGRRPMTPPMAPAAPTAPPMGGHM